MLLPWHLSVALLLREAVGGHTDVLDWSLALFQFQIWNCGFWTARDERNVHLCATSQLRDYTRIRLRWFQGEQPLAAFCCCTTLTVMCHTGRWCGCTVSWGNRGGSAARFSSHTNLFHNKTPANGLAQRRVRIFPEVREGNLPHPDDIVWASKELLFETS